MSSNTKARISKVLLISIVTLFLGGAQCTGPAEGLTGSRGVSSPDSVDLLFRKHIPEEVVDAASEALSHYPELQNTYIIFSYDEEFRNAFMQAQPKISSIFDNQQDRVYKIIMTRNISIDDSIIPVEKVPHKVLVGWIGHELGHIMDYTERSSLNMIWFGARYLVSDKYKVTAERKADLFAIKHGLAEEIIATKNFILSNTSLPRAYVEKIERLYLSPENVLEIVQELEDELEEEEEASIIEPYPLGSS